MEFNEQQLEMLLDKAGSYDVLWLALCLNEAFIPYIAEVMTEIVQEEIQIEEVDVILRAIEKVLEKAWKYDECSK